MTRQQYPTSPGLPKIPTASVDHWPMPNPSKQPAPISRRVSSHSSVSHIIESPAIRVSKAVSLSIPATKRMSMAGPLTLKSCSFVQVVRHTRCVIPPSQDLPTKIRRRSPRSCPPAGQRKYSDDCHICLVQCKLPCFVCV